MNYCFTRNSFVVTALWAGVLSWCRIQLPERHFSGWYLHSVVEALQDCFVEFLTYHLSSRDVLMMNQPVNVKEHNQHGLDIGLHLPRFLWSRRWCRVSLTGHLLCFRVIPINPAFVTSDYLGHEFGIILGSLMKVSANWRDCPSAPPSGDGAQISLSNVSCANLQLEFSGTYRMLF